MYFVYLKNLEIWKSGNLEIGKSRNREIGMWLGRQAFFRNRVFMLFLGLRPPEGNHVFTNVGYLRMEENYMEGI